MKPDDLRQLIEAVRAGDVAGVRDLVERRPELARMSADNFQVVHHAVLNRSPEIVRLLMRHGANARDGVYPHRDATTALGIATDRGDEEIVAIILEEEQRRSGRSALAHDQAPPQADDPAQAAVSRGDVEWLRARYAAGGFENAITPSGGLLTLAAISNRPEILALLLDFGFDPDERGRFGEGDEPVFTWGMPLWHCAGSGKHAMAEMLLRRGADPNARVYASGSPVFQAYSQLDWPMVELLRRYGGVPEATTAGLYRRTDLARQMLAGEAEYKLDGVGGTTLAEQLLWGAACGGDPEIVRLALERVDWARDDVRWFDILEQPLRLWTHGSGSADWDRGSYFECFRLVSGRCDPNLRGRLQDKGQFGLTILHSIAGARAHVTSEDRAAFATVMLDAGARLDLRDNLLKSTPLGWACRWGCAELVRLLLDRGADPEEQSAESWATPRAWAQKKGHAAVLAALDEAAS